MSALALKIFSVSKVATYLYRRQMKLKGRQVDPLEMCSHLLSRDKCHSSNGGRQFKQLRRVKRASWKNTYMVEYKDNQNSGGGRCRMRWFSSIQSRRFHAFFWQKQQCVFKIEGLYKSGTFNMISNFQRLCLNEFWCARLGGLRRGRWGGGLKTVIGNQDSVKDRV